ncbi:MAG: hypothetical protein NC483_07190 [Ruminococcus sp.]|nr:hypothetical protein [Ruminococcus sp.]
MSNLVDTKIEKFFRVSSQYLGKEIGLLSGQHFSIAHFRSKEKADDGTLNYLIQYGFPQSGAVCLNFDYLPAQNAVTINKIEVFAPEAGKEMTLASFAPQAQVAEFGISINFGVDNNTKPHLTHSEIEANPNALKMLDLAIDDLAHAQVIGECQLCVPKDSDYIPCASSSRIDRDFPNR